MAVNDGEVVKGVAELVLDDGTITQNVFYFQADFTSESLPNQDVLDAVESYIEDIYTAVLAHIDPAVTWNPAPCDVVTWDETEEIWEVTKNLGNASPSVTFTGTTDPAPNQIAPVLVANTNRPKTRGRKFIIGFDEGSMAGSELTSSAMTGLGNALNHYLADETIAAGDDLIVGVPSTVDGVFRPFTDGVANDIVGTQRRRKPGIGI